MNKFNNGATHYVPSFASTTFYLTNIKPYCQCCERDDILMQDLIYDLYSYDKQPDIFGEYVYNPNDKWPVKFYRVREQITVCLQLMDTYFKLRNNKDVRTPVQILEEFFRKKYNIIEPWQID